MTLPQFDAAFFSLLACVLVAGVARGLSGFGTGMIVAPIAGALYGPKAALAIIVIIDSLPIVPVTLPVMRIARWKEVLPIAAGLFFTVPLGVALLKYGDPELLRWTICAAILACVTALWSGWRYHGPRGAPVSLAVGGVAGVLSGMASIPGPPIIIYWMASGLTAAVMRASLLTVFLIGEVFSIANLWIAGLFTSTVVALGLLSAPVYFAGLLCGWRLFGFASDRTYRLITYALIVTSAVLALPALDGFLSVILADR